jgi:hypothetical protein
VAKIPPDILKMPRFRRRRIPIIIAPIRKTNRRAGEFADIRVVEARNIDRVEISAENIEVAATERANPTMLAEKVVHAVGAELVVRQSVLARDHPKRVGFDDDAPISRLAADGAVALTRAGAQIDVGFVSDFAAMAACSIGLGAHVSLAPEVMMISTGETPVYARALCSE